MLGGWVVILFSQALGGWLTHPHETLDKIYVGIGWLVMLTPAVVPWLMG